MKRALVAALLAGLCGCENVREHSSCPKTGLTTSSDARRTYNELIRDLDKNVGIEHHSIYSDRMPIIFIPDYNHHDEDIKKEYVQKATSFFRDRGIALGGIGLEGIVRDKEDTDVKKFKGSPFIATIKESGMPIIGIEEEVNYERSLLLLDKITIGYIGAFNDLFKQLNEKIISLEEFKTREDMLNKETETAKKELFETNTTSRSYDWIRNCSKFDKTVILVGGAGHIETVFEAAREYKKPIIMLRIESEDARKYRTQRK
jgi:hypothetical protein